MPFVMEIDGMAEVSEMLTKLEEDAPKIAAKALYEGAGIMAKEILSEMAKVKTAPFKYATGGEKRLPHGDDYPAAAADDRINTVTARVYTAPCCRRHPSE